MPRSRQHILLSEAEGNQAICFDTGLDSRAFARTKMSQSLIEKGYIVNPDGSNEAWVSSGVCEIDGHMRVWGKPFVGERFDIILANDNQEQAIKAVSHWIKAKVSLGGTDTTLNPAAAFINTDGSVFFAPPNLSTRCLHVEGIDIDYFNCPDLEGMDAAAFCAAAMLYKILSKSLPFSNKATLYQDMREGVFLPPHLALPGLNKELCTLIQTALLLPVEKKGSMQTYSKSAQDILNGILSLLSSASLFEQVPDEEAQKLEKEKKSYLFKQKIVVKTKRFAIRNKYPLIGAAVVIFFITFVIVSSLSGTKRRPTTDGMSSDTVVNTYYNSLSSLHHVFMEACTQGSDPIIKNDIAVATNYFVIVKTRQSYENSRVMPFTNANAWKESGGELPAPDVFGVTDLVLEQLSGSETDSMIVYRADYLLWAPNEDALQRTDILTLKRDKKNNWRITEIKRTEK